MSAGSSSEYCVAKLGSMCWFPAASVTRIGTMLTPTRSYEPVAVGVGCVREVDVGVLGVDEAVAVRVVYDVQRRRHSRKARVSAEVRAGVEVDERDQPVVVRVLDRREDAG